MKFEKDSKHKDSNPKDERDFFLHKLAQVCDVPYSTLKNTEQRSGQLTVDMIERVCLGLHIPMSFFSQRRERELAVASNSLIVYVQVKVDFREDGIMLPRKII